MKEHNTIQKEYNTIQKTALVMIGGLIVGVSSIIGLHIHDSLNNTDKERERLEHEVKKDFKTHETTIDGQTYFICSLADYPFAVTDQNKVATHATKQSIKSGAYKRCPHAKNITLMNANTKRVLREYIGKGKQIKSLFH